MVEELGRVTGVSLGREPRGILTFSVNLDFGGSVQGFGGYALDTYDKEKRRRVEVAPGTDLILRLLDLFGISHLEEATGKSVIAIREAPFRRIIGLKMPKFDGGRTFMIADWQRDWEH